MWRILSIPFFSVCWNSLPTSSSKWLCTMTQLWVSQIGCLVCFASMCIECDLHAAFTLFSMNIAVTNEEGRTVPLLSQSHDLPSKSHDLPSKSHDLPSKSHDHPSQSHDLPSQSHDLPSQSHDLEQLSEDMLHYMQLEQVSPEQYCHSVIATVTSLLLGYLSKHIPQLKEEAESGEPGSNHRPLSVYIAICLQLLAAVVNLLEQVRRHSRTPELSQMNNTLVRTHTHM